MGQAAAVTSSSPAAHHAMNMLASASVCELRALMEPVMSQRGMDGVAAMTTISIREENLQNFPFTV